MSALKRRVPALLGVALCTAVCCLSFGITTLVSATASSGASPTGPPSLTASQRQEVTRLAAGNRYFKALTRNHHPHLAAVAPWTDLEGDLIGGAASFAFSKPVASISGTWLGLDYDCSEKHHQLTGHHAYKRRYPDVASLTVYVQLHPKQVDGVDPSIDVGASALEHPAPAVLRKPGKRHVYLDNSCMSKIT